MKRIILSILIFLSISIVSNAQTMIFSVFESNVTNQETGDDASIDVDFNITLTDYVLILGDAKTYTFTSDITNVTTKQFYVYANDNENDSRCRIWFTALGGTRANFEIEYSDFSFLYKTNRIK